MKLENLIGLITGSEEENEAPAKKAEKRNQERLEGHKQENGEREQYR
jgi:hypothetical protein